MVELVEVGPEDWRVWRELRLRALAEAPYAFKSALAEWQGDGDREQRWRDRLAIPGSYNVVALVDGQPVGMASGFPEDDPDVVWLHSMWVDPARRGKGVGDRLVAAVVAWAARSGARAMMLGVVEGNTSAEALYARHGFSYTGEVNGMMPDGVRRDLAMARPLGA
ncbi:GNAT family N-acetyltransferase [Phytohabitans suffuscus]|uniref:N-acetyltransferase n=1 Tax=Phytohabitans suffuscus TaxID=624315 RepID=A0A6F8YZD7_9ACTN|nr:GNAT family N-acetyltransferase [Phytohabitans suffuscus]BCB91201.1 N-acetyltransferase [Phytohabitans suffuscus]